jgi:hypothetical protein
VPTAHHRVSPDQAERNRPRRPTTTAQHIRYPFTRSAHIPTPTVWILFSNLVEAQEAAEAVPNSTRRLRTGDLVEVIQSGEVRRILEINAGTPMLYRACGLPAATSHVHGRGKFDPVTDPCEWYLAAELKLLS